MPAAAQPREHLVPQNIMPLSMVAHMKYLMKLIDLVFSLQVVGEECFWVVSKEFQRIAENEILEALIPPSTGR